MGNPDPHSARLTVPPRRSNNLTPSAHRIPAPPPRVPSSDRTPEELLQRCTSHRNSRRHLMAAAATGLAPVVAAVSTRGAVSTRVRSSEGENRQRDGAPGRLPDERGTRLPEYRWEPPAASRGSHPVRPARAGPRQCGPGVGSRVGVVPAGTAARQGRTHALCTADPSARTASKRC